MDKELFLATLGTVHALFGKAAPAHAITQALWERVADYPDAVLPLFEQRLELAEKLPANLYREFHAAREDWQRLVSLRKAVSTACPECAGKHGFWCWLREPSGRWHHFFAPCHLCQSPKGQPAPSVQRLRERGVLVMPPHYPGGPTAFDRDHHLGVLCPVRAQEMGKCFDRGEGNPLG